MAGAATAVFFWSFPELAPWQIHEGILGLAVHIPVLVAVSLLTPAQGPDHLGRFFSAGKEGTVLSAIPASNHRGDG